MVLRFKINTGYILFNLLDYVVHVEVYKGKNVKLKIEPESKLRKVIAIEGILVKLIVNFTPNNHSNDFLFFLTFFFYFGFQIKVRRVT